MKHVYLLCLGLIAFGAYAEEPKSAEPAPAEAPPAAETKTTEVRDLEPADAKKDDKAAKSSDDDDGGVTYSAIGLSRVSTPFDNIEPAINLTAVLGIRIPTIDIVAAEIEFGQSIIPGENNRTTTTSSGGSGGLPLLGGGSPPSSTTTRSGDDFQMFSIGVLGVLRTPPEWFHGLYAKAKAGYGYVQSNLEEFNEDSSGTAFGIGGGWQYGPNGGVELLYSRYPGDLEYLGVSVSYGFGGNIDD